MLSSAAFALNVEYRGIVKDPVQSTQQGILLVKVGSPKGRILVAGKDNIEDAIFGVSSVNQIKEQPCMLPVELTASYFIDNPAERAH